MTIDDVKNYRFIMKGLTVTTTSGITFERGDEFFTKNGELRKGYVMTNKL